MRAKIIVVVALILSVSFLLGMGRNESKKQSESTGYNQALLNICDYGAIPNDGKDDSLAFELTITAGNEPIYLPPGTYNISKSIIAQEASIIGAGSDKTVIIADFESAREPIIWVGGHSQIRDLTIKFAEHCINGTEVDGERVGIITTSKAKGSLTRGGSISNVRIENVGTGLYIPNKNVIEQFAPAGNDDWGTGCAFSATFENISVIDFSFRGVCAESTQRTGNIWRNIYLSSGKYEANTAYYTTRAESESSMSEITVANSKLKNAVRFEESYGITMTNLTIINTQLIEDNTAFLYYNKSNIILNGFTVINSAPQGDKQSFIRVGDVAYRDTYYYPTAGFLHIYNMSILNPDIEVFVDANQYMIARINGYLSEATVEIDNFRVVAPKDIKAQYEAFNYDKRDINLILCGEKR